MATWRREEFKTGQGAISYLIWDRAGPAAPWVHFAHANGFNAQTYVRLLEPLSDRLNLVAWDARGHGQTTLLANPEQMMELGWGLYEQDLRGFLAYLNRPILLAGHSLGSVVSLLVASKSPEVAKGLFLVDPVILPPGTNIMWGFAKFLGRNREFGLVKKAQKRRRQFESRQAIIDSYRGRGGFKTWMCGGCLEGYVEGGTRDLPDGSVELTCDPKWESATFSQMSEWGWRALMKTVIPVTILYGAQSDTFLSKTAKATRQLAPRIRLISVPDSSHFVPMEEPELVGQALQRMALGEG